MNQIVHVVIKCPLVINNNQANYFSGSGLACMASEEQTLQAFNFKSNLQTTPSICQPFAKH